MSYWELALYKTRIWQDNLAISKIYRDININTYLKKILSIYTIYNKKKHIGMLAMMLLNQIKSKNHLIIKKLIFIVFVLFYQYFIDIII